MLHGSERWRSHAGLGLELSSHPVWCGALMGLDQPVQSIISAPGMVMMSSACPLQRASAAHLPRAFPGGDKEILAGSSCHAPYCLVLRDRSRSFSGTHFLPARGETISCKLPSPQGGEAFTSSSPQREKARPGAWQRLAGGSAIGIIPGLLLGNG
jgi:hypothetical protein